MPPVAQKFGTFRISMSLQDANADKSMGVERIDWAVNAKASVHKNVVSTLLEHVQ